MQSQLSTVPRVRLHQIRTGSVAMAPGYVFRREANGVLEAFGRGVPREKFIVSPIGAFLIEHPDGPIVIDTGMHPICASRPRRNVGAIAATAFKSLRMRPGENVPAQLRARGLEPDDIRLVLMTHLHVDHTSAMSEFRRARFVTTEAEWEAARSRLGALSGYRRSHLPDPSRVQFVGFANGEPLDGLSRTVDLLGDGTLRLVSTPGHSVGHLSVLIATEDGPVFVLGDAVYTLRNLHEDLLPWRTADDELSRRTMAELRRYAAAHPDVPLIPTHDPDLWDAFEER